MKKTKKISQNIGQYPVIVQEDVSGGYWASCLSLEGCYSQGETLDGALVNIRESIDLCLEDIPKR